MKEHIVYEYEESDFADIRREMTLEKAIDIVSWLKRGWFPYKKPSWEKNVTSADLGNYEICCAIDMVVEALNGKHD